ncbi:hypothetical protein KAT24_01050 [Candidatus Pacearchaeota archaeon]|nr:hypothetical protein [Candidatus Pacearchaeota archaeon]
MVKTLEVQTSEFVDLKKFREDIKKYNDSIDDRNYSNETYMCDCDSFGGGDAPCDCNR